MRKLTTINLPSNFDRNTTKVLEDSEQVKWLVTRDDIGYKVFHNSCPHQGHDLKSSSDKFICNGHGWIFNKDGSNKTYGGQRLDEVKIVNKNNHSLKIEYFDNVKISKDQKLDLEIDLNFLSHACLELNKDEYSLMSDPWITGNTYHGNWEHWPNNKNLKFNKSPNLILLTHAHPDHFHMETLENFDRDIDIFFPDFLSGRIEKKLLNKGFKSVNPTPYNENISYQDNIEFTFLRPSSKWEDSIFQLSFFGFRWLNLNDAGYINKDAILFDKFDLLTATFDIFATDYPICWPKIDNRILKKHLTNSKESILNHLVNLNHDFNSDYYLPFASFWRLNSEKFKNLEKYMDHVNIQDIRNKFEQSSSSTKILDLLPGEKYQWLNKKRTESIKNREIFIEGESNNTNKKNEVKFPKFSPEQCNSEHLDDDRALLSSSLDEFSSKSEFYNCEKVLFEIKCTCEEVHVIKKFGEKSKNKEVKISLKAPIELIRLWIKDEINFEELRIGYWAEFKRDINVYTPNLLRLLAVGKSISKFPNNIDLDTEILNMPISEIYSKNPGLVTKILNTGGLPCVSCSHFNQEILNDAFEIHNISSDDKHFLIKQLEGVVKN